MKRTTSTAKTRGKVTRIITTTTATVKAYNITTDEIEEFAVEIPGSVNERKIISTVSNGDYIDTDSYKILAVKNVETTGTLYAMDIETFLEHAEIIEDGITD